MARLEPRVRVDAPPTALGIVDRASSDMSPRLSEGTPRKDIGCQILRGPLVERQVAEECSGMSPEPEPLRGV
jgi:hypothetical protein